MVLAALLRREVGLTALCTVLAWFIVGGGLVSAFAGILQHYELRGPLESVIATKLTSRAYGNLVQSNHFAAHLALALASLGLLAARSRLPVALAALAAGVLLFGLALAASITAWVYLLLQTLLAGALYLRERTDASLRLVLYALALLLGFAAAQAVAATPWLTAPVPVVTATERLFEPVPSFNVRLQLWHEALLIFLQAPLLGAGWGQFAWHHFMQGGAAGVAPLHGLYHHAHNIVLHLLAETGVVGAAIPVVGVTVWLGGLRRIGFGLECWWLLALLAVLGVHSLNEYPLWYMHFLGIAALLFGIGESAIRPLERGRIAQFGVGAALVVGWLSAASLIRNYSILEMALFPRAHKASTAEIAQTNRALLEAHGSLLAPYVELAFARALDLDSRDVEKKLQFSSRVMRFAPTEVIAYQHSLLAALSGDLSQAAQVLDRAVALYPVRLERFSRELENLDPADRGKIAPYLERIRKHREAQQRGPGR
jgi:O-antigen ligase